MKLASRLYSSFICISVFVLLLAGCGGSGNVTPPDNPTPTTLAGAVDGVANSELKQQGIPGMTVALAKNGSVLYVKAYGMADVDSKAATQAGTIFQIGSITKQFTAALIMKLQEQGKLDADDLVSKYLPAYSWPETLSLRMLLTHTSGLANYTGFTQNAQWSANGVSEPTVLKAICEAPLLFQPGTQWSYSNSNYFVLGVIIEKLSGQSYELILKQTIFNPLSLTSTYYVLPPASQAAVGYTYSASGPIPAQIVDRSAPFAAGALSSNVYDLIAWDNALIHGKVVSADSFKEMTEGNPNIPGAGAYGFGLGLGTFNGRATIGHNGAINGFTAETKVILDSGFTIVVLTNTDIANTDAITSEIMNAVCNVQQFSSNC
jgi:CubicO group peptidase (beta-lactamase class C family)